MVNESAVPQLDQEDLFSQQEFEVSSSDFLKVPDDLTVERVEPIHEQPTTLPEYLLDPNDDTSPVVAFEVDSPVVDNQPKNIPRDTFTEESFQTAPQKSIINEGDATLVRTLPPVIPEGIPESTDNLPVSSIGKARQLLRKVKEKLQPAK